MDCSPPDYSVHRILQARVLEWVAMPSSRGFFFDLEIEPKSLMSPALGGGFLTSRTTWEASSLFNDVKNEELKKLM